MKAWTLGPSFGLDHLRLEERAPAPLGPGQVRVALKAMALNYRDHLMVAGQYNPRQPLPLIPCSDGAGEVVETGPSVSRVAVGARVCPIFAQSWLTGAPTRDRLRSTLGGPVDGTLASEIVLDQQALVTVPDHLSWEQAACLPCAYLTAWSALVTQAHVQAGDCVLILGTGGVSVAALQIARSLGLRTALLSSSDEKLASLDADFKLNYKSQPQWAKAVRAWAAPEGVDLVVEVGGATLGQSLQVLRVGGQISMIGVLAGAQETVNVLPILMNNLRVQGILVGHRDGFEAMNRAIRVWGWAPHVHHSFAFEDAPEAFRTLVRAEHMGKICIHA